MQATSLWRFFFGSKRRLEMTPQNMPQNPTDLSRWSNPANLHHEWDARTLEMAKLVPPNSRVLEFGAARMVLRDHLPEGCVYIPSDLVDRGPGTLVCDLNSPNWPALPDVDVIFFAGVLEYLSDVQGVLARLKPLCKTIVTSYEVNWQPTPQTLKVRTKLGWINHMSWPELEVMFRECGFGVAAISRWNASVLARFEKR